MTRGRATGTLFNEGIAISRDALLQLEAHLPLVHSDGERPASMEYFDEQIGRRILIRYAGDAKFKGVRSSFPVYAVEAEATDGRRRRALVGRAACSARSRRVRRRRASAADRPRPSSPR